MIPKAVLVLSSLVPIVVYSPTFAIKASATVNSQLFSTKLVLFLQY